MAFSSLPIFHLRQAESAKKQASDILIWLEIV